MTNAIYFIIFIFISNIFKTDTCVYIKPVSRIKLHVAEPSDIVMNADMTGYYIVSDNGFLHETDFTGRIIRTATYAGYDFEGVCLAGEQLYVSDESLRQVLVYDQKNFDLIRTLKIEYNGARNLGCESLTFNTESNRFIMATEKDPLLIFELDENFRILNQRSVDGIREISSATFFNKFLYFLSDEQMTVFRVDPIDYRIVKQWKIPVLNPEGICFNKNGELLIASDDLATLFNFGNLK